MYFPVSGVETSLWVPPLFAFVAAFFCSMGGISGAFLLLPFQVSVLGYTAPSVSATNQVFNLVAIPSGVYRYIREKRMVWPLTWVVVLGTVPGVLIGAWLRVVFLPDPAVFKLFVGCVLLYIAARMVKDLVNNTGSRRANAKAPANRTSARSMAVVSDCVYSLRRIEYSFEGTKYTCSTFWLFLLSLIVGIVGCIYGIGGGSIVAPFLVVGFKLPVYTVAGAVLMGTFITSITGVFAFQLLASVYPHLLVTPDWLLGLCFGIGGIAGMYLGARCQKYFPAAAIKTILCISILIVAVRYIVGFFHTLL